jgi:hypothetical protein
MYFKYIANIWSVIVLNLKYFSFLGVENINSIFWQNIASDSHSDRNFVRLSWLVLGQWKGEFWRELGSE